VRIPNWPPWTKAGARASMRAIPFFSPAGCFLAVDEDGVIGFALTSLGADLERALADPSVGVVDGLFFPRDRLEVGDALLGRCMAYLARSGGVRTVYGFASLGGYPYWRGLYCGAELVCLTHHTHAWVIFMARGFVHHQQSINYFGIPEPRAYRSDLQYDISSEWARQSWKGHRPRVITVRKDSQSVGAIGCVHLPFLSAHRGKSVSGIYSLRVDPSFRRQGIASSLMNFFFARAYERGVEEVLVGTTVENTAARRTYEKAGMKPIAFRTGTMYHYSG
jgi:ribosomal protein S18 acetylase RimI-like enzyme